jgi:hypothetical protein
MPVSRCPRHPGLRIFVASFGPGVDVPTVASPEDALRALATILQNGTPDDWRALDHDALVSVLEAIPVFGRAALAARRWRRDIWGIGSLKTLIVLQTWRLMRPT